MKKIYLIILSFTLSCGIAFSKHLEPQQALDRLSMEQTPGITSTRSASTPKLIRQVSLQDSGTPQLYLFENTDNLLVVSASDKTPALLGYFDNKDLLNITGDLPPDLEWWLNEYAAQIDKAEGSQSFNLYSGNISRAAKESYGPFITTQWHQNRPYNNECPKSNTSNMPTGNVAVAMAQVMNYHKWPEHGEGTHSYTKVSDTYYINFSEITFDWAHMLDKYDDQSSEESIKAVAMLMKACGYAVDTQYLNSFSVASTSLIPDRASQFFSYSKNASFVDRLYYSSAQWEDMILDQLSKGLPVIYTGKTGLNYSGSEHCFICDGYDGNGYYHINWGYGGEGDGYFLLSSLVPQDTSFSDSQNGFNYGQACLLNFYPDNKDIPPVKSISGSNFSFSANTIQARIYPSNPSLYNPTMNFGLEFTSTKNNASLVYPTGELTLNSTYWFFYAPLRINNLKDNGIEDGEYLVKIVYQEDDQWKNVSFETFQNSEVLVIIDGSDLKLSDPGAHNDVKISEIKFNGGRNIIRGIDNTVTYTAMNESDEPIFWITNYFLKSVNSTYEGSSILSANITIQPHATVEIKETLPSNAFYNSAGEYNIIIKGGPSTLNQKYIYNDPEEVYYIKSTESLISDGTFDYMELSDGKMILWGLSSGVSKLGGNVVIPDEVKINGKNYEVVSMKCRISDLINITTIESLDIRNPITSLPASAFVGASKLKKIILPSTLETIGAKAFYYCTSLEEITIPEGIKEIGNDTFYGCTALSSVSLPSTLQYIGQSAFSSCSNLEEIELPVNIVSIGAAVFNRCTALKKISLPAGLTELPDNVFTNCTSLETVEMPQRLISIGNYAFSYCYSLKSIILPEGLTNISAYCFFNCSSLESIVIPEGVVEINTYAFNECKSLKSAILPSSLELLGDHIFYFCITLESIDIPDSVKEIGEYCFYQCEALKTLKLPKSLQAIPRNTFSYCKALEKVEIPESVTSIGRSAFYRCDSMTSLKMSDSVVEIDYGVFQSCKQLSEVKLSDNIKVIPQYAFDDTKIEKILLPSKLESIENRGFNSCPDLREIEFPAGLQKIGDGAFSYCYNISYIKSNAANPPELSSNAFPSSYNSVYSKATLQVPDESLDIYREAEIWGNFARIIPMSYKPVKSINLDVETLTLKIDDTYTLQVTLDPVDASYQTLRWTSTAEAIAYVDNTGTITATGVGVATIIAEATDDSGVTAQCTVTVLPTLVERIDLEADEFYVRKDKKINIEATVYPANAEIKSLKWESSDEEVARCLGDGYISGEKEGTATITVTALDGSEVSNSFSIHVLPILKGDSNDNDIVTVADAVNIANYAIGKQVEYIYTEASDVNSDGKITMADASGTITIILNNEITSHATRSSTDMAGSDFLETENFIGTAGIIQNVQVYMNNITDYTAIQGDIILPAGMEFETIYPGQRLGKNHTLAFNKLDNEIIRFIIFDPNSSLLKASGEPLLTLQVKNKGNVYDNISIHNIYASDSYARDFILYSIGGDSHLSSGIDSVDSEGILIIPRINGVEIINAEGNEIMIFNMAGIMIRSFKANLKNHYIELEPGIYLLKVGDQNIKIKVN